MLKFSVEDPEERHLLNKREIEFRRENKQIWDELAHFVKVGKLLGNHKSFEYERLLKEFALIDNNELVKKYSLIQNYRLKARNRIKSLDDINEIAKVTKRLQDYDLQEKCIKTLLKMTV